MFESVLGVVADSKQGDPFCRRPSRKRRNLSLSLAMS